MESLLAREQLMEIYLYLELILTLLLVKRRRVIVHPQAAAPIVYMGPELKAT